MPQPWPEPSPAHPARAHLPHRLSLPSSPSGPCSDISQLSWCLTQLVPHSPRNVPRCIQSGQSSHPVEVMCTGRGGTGLKQGTPGSWGRLPDGVAEGRGSTWLSTSMAMSTNMSCSSRMLVSSLMISLCLVSISFSACFVICESILI